MLVQHPLRLGVRRVVQLESSIEQKSVYLIGADASTDILGRFQKSDIESVDCALACGGKAGDSRANDDDVMCHGLVTLDCLRDGGLHEGVLEPETGLDQRDGHHSRAAENFGGELTQY